MSFGLGRIWLAGSTSLLVLWLGVTAPAVAAMPPIQVESRDVDGPAGAAAVVASVQHYFAVTNYAAIDEFTERLVASEQRSADGSWILSAVPSGIASHHNSDEWWAFGGTDSKDRLLEQVAAWRKKLPQSTVADLAEAIIYTEWAWHIRGHGFANTVEAKAWKPFAEGLHRAQEILQRSKETASSNPLWYQLSLSVATDLHSDEHDFRALYDEAIARFPEYEPLYGEMLRYVSPRWYGSVDAVDAYIAEAVKHMPAKQRKIMYTRLYWGFDSGQRQDFQLFEETKASWRKMKAGFEELMKEYPDSSWNLNNFASFACRAHDADTYRRLRGQIGGRVYSQAWYTDEIEGCDRSLSKAS